MTIDRKLAMQNAIGKLSTGEYLAVDEVYRVLTEIKEGKATEVQIGVLGSPNDKGTGA